MAVETSIAPQSRRAILAALGGGLAALIAQALGRPLPVRADHGQPGQDLLKNVTNSATATTRLSADLFASDVLEVANNTGSGAGTAIRGTTHGATGVRGETQDGTGVHGLAKSVGVGVRGESWSSDGVEGVGIGAGVYGTGGYGVMGDVDVGGTGVYGFVGSQAAPLAPANVAVYASAPSAAHTALQVNGRARFSRANKTAVGVGYSSKRVNMAGVTVYSIILGTIQQNRPGYSLQAVVAGNGYFTIYLNKAVTTSPIWVAYFVAETR